MDNISSPLRETVGPAEHKMNINSGPLSETVGPAEHKMDNISSPLRETVGPTEYEMNINSGPLRETVGPAEHKMNIYSGPLRETVGPAEHKIWKIEVSALVNSPTAEGETNICKIFKVPEQIIRDDNKHSFKPKIVSIGPYNDRSSHLRDMERVKRRYAIFDREYYLRDETLRDETQELQRKARSFYSENITMGPKWFAEMLLDDGCFILLALIGMKRRVDGYSSDDDLEEFNRPDILHDLLLVENQIPFFVLVEINKIVADQGETTESLKEKIATAVERVLYQYPKAIKSSEICRNDFHHLVHLCHMFFRPSLNSVEHHHDQAVKNQWHRAKQYHEAGVEFRVKPSSTGCSLLDVTFSNGTMEIPHLSIDANTESIFSNLILFEKSGCPHAGNYINAYITFMSKLLGTADDVELLVRERIIEIVGYNEEILVFFRRLSRLAVYPGEHHYLESTLQSVEAHYRLRALKLSKAWLKHNLLTNPCVALATLGGIIVLICTVTQAVFAVLQYYTPPK